MNNAEIKRCPFCGGDNTLIDKKSNRNIRIVCNATDKGCGSSSGYHSTEEDAIRAWNMRIDDRKSRFEEERKGNREMNENEAIEELQAMRDLAEFNIGQGNARGLVYVPKDRLLVLDAAIKALQETRQYRAIGTVDECRENKRFLNFLCSVINPNEMESYLTMYHATNEKGGDVE